MTFNIIRKAGDPNKVTLNLKSGKRVTVERPLDDKIFVPEYKNFVRCAPYGVHFIFEVPKSIFPAPSYMCSCGSAAVAVGSKAYTHLGSAEGLMFVCQHHLDYNKHSDGVK